MERSHLDLKRIIICIIAGAIAFLIAGTAAGIVLLQQEGQIGFPVEGIVGGLVFGFFMKGHYSIVRTVIASTLAIVIGIFGGAFVGLLIYDGFGVPALISGFLTGAVFSLVMGFGKGFLRFSLICAVIYFLGDMFLNYINVGNGPFFDFVTGRLGEDGYKVAIVALTAVYHGKAIGLGTGVQMSMDAKTEAGER